MSARRQLRRKQISPSVVVTEHVALKRALSSAEIVLLQAFVSEPLRPQAWRFATAAELFETPLGERIANAIGNAFPHAPPGGKSGLWLHLIEPEELRQALIDLTFDFRAENVSDETLVDSVARLRDNRETRGLEEMRRQGVDRQALFERIKERKPDTRPAKHDPNTFL